MFDDQRLRKRGWDTEVPLLFGLLTFQPPRCFTFLTYRDLQPKIESKEYLKQKILEIQRKQKKAFLSFLSLTKGNSKKEFSFLLFQQERDYLYLNLKIA